MLNVGVDLGIKSKHVAVAADQLARKVGNPINFGTSGREIDGMLNKLKEFAPDETRYRFLMEPTPTWKLVAGYLKSRGHEVFLVAQSETHDLRKAIKRHEKSDHLDALTLAKLPFVSPERLHPAPLPPNRDWDALCRGVKRVYKMAKRIAELKTSIQESAEEAIPGISELFPDPSERLARLVYRSYCDPRKLQGMTPEALKGELEQKLCQPVGLEEVTCLISLAEEAMVFHREGYVDLCAIQKHIEYDMAELAVHEARHEMLKEENLALYKKLDPQGYVMSLPGVGELIAPILLALKPIVDYMANAKRLRAYIGFVPEVDKSGQSDKKGTKMTKAGPGLFKWAIYVAADVARRIDPQLAMVYHRSMTQKGNPHTKAVCEVAVHLIDRLFCVLKEWRAYELRAVDGSPVTKAQAKEIIMAKYTVSEEVRRRLRNRRRVVLNIRDDAVKQLPAGLPPSRQQNITTGTSRSRDPESIKSILSRTMPMESETKAART